MSEYFLQLLIRFKSKRKRTALLTLAATDLGVQPRFNQFQSFHRLLSSLVNQVTLEQ